MRSITDYVKEYGKYDFSHMPPNGVDALVLSQLSYLKFDGILPGLNEGRQSIGLREVYAHCDYENLFSDERFRRHNKALFRACKDSLRFSTLLINNYVSILEPEWETQFSAMTFTCHDMTFVVFRGTDETLVGWKEDFNMALKSPVPAQEKAVSYLNVVAAKSRQPLFVCGHSKGGNLAVYASMKCRKSIKGRIEKIYNLDGPGFRPEVLESGDFDKIRDKIEKFVPHSSIVGMIMESKEEKEVIECRNFGILQHDPFNWVVEDGEFKKVRAIYRYTELKDEALNKWIYSLQDDEITIFVESLYSVMTAGGTETLLDIIRRPGKTSAAMIKAMEETEEDTREILKAIMGKLVRRTSETFRADIEAKLEEKMAMLDESEARGEALPAAIMNNEHVLKAREKAQKTYERVQASFMELFGN